MTCLKLTVVKDKRSGLGGYLSVYSYKLSRGIPKSFLIPFSYPKLGGFMKLINLSNELCKICKKRLMIMSTATEPTGVAYEEFDHNDIPTMKMKEKYMTEYYCPRCDKKYKSSGTRMAPI